MPSKPRDRVGDVYGQLTVVRASERRTKSGNAFWWCRCSCGREREVAGDKLSHNTARKKPVVTACLVCSRELQIEAVYAKNDREEMQRRADAERRRVGLQGKVPDRWLQLPLTDAHARELGQVLFFRGTRCLRDHLAPYRINGGCLACAGQTPSADPSTPVSS
ncbi:MAG: early protein (E6) [Synechococcus sp.]